MDKQVGGEDNEDENKDKDTKVGVEDNEDEDKDMDKQVGVRIMRTKIRIGTHK